MRVKHIRSVMMTFNVVLTGLVIWMAAMIVFDRDEPVLENDALLADRQSAAATPDPESRRRAHLAAYGAIIEKDMFDTIPATPQTRTDTRAPEEKELVPTRLNVTLEGTIVGDRHSYAVIVDGRTRAEGIYAVGDTLQSARIAEILSDRVIFEYDDRREVLMLFPEQTDPDAPPAARPRPPQNPRSGSAPPRANRLPGR